MASRKKLLKTEIYLNAPDDLFAKSLKLAAANTDNIDAELNNGVLGLIRPNVENAKPRQIAVKAG